MIRVASTLFGALLVSRCLLAQGPPEHGRALAEASKQAKVTIVDAVQKATAALHGAAVHASLAAATKDRPPTWQVVVVLRDGTLFAVPIDAVSGAVGKARELKDNDLGTDEKTGQQHAVRLAFEDVPPGSLPAGWVAAETAGAGHPATWSVAELKGAPSGNRALRLAAKNSGETFNLLLSTAAFPADLGLAVAIHADAGDEDRGGGLVWRAVDADNYYIARWNPLEDNLRAYKVVAGVRTMLKSVDVAADAAQWHTLRVRAQGTGFQVAFDDKVLLECEDATFAQGGKVGLWTKADAQTNFDDFRVSGK